MHWPPVHGGPIYWFVRRRLFEASTFKQRIVRIIKENYDRQRLINVMEPKMSYDYRVNYWFQRPEKEGSTGVVAVFARDVNYYIIRPVLGCMFIWWLMHELWRQETHPFQIYKRWSKTHREDLARQALEIEED